MVNSGVIARRPCCVHLRLLQFAIDATSGQKLWELQVVDASHYGDSVSSAVLSPDGATVFIGASDHNLYAFNAADGKKKWMFNTGERKITASPAVSADGRTVFVGSNDGRLYAVVAVDGKQKWAFDTNCTCEVWATPKLSRDGHTIFVGSVGHTE